MYKSKHVREHITRSLGYLGFSVVLAFCMVGCGDDVAELPSENGVYIFPDEREACADSDPLRSPYFGDLHIHTRYSFDAVPYKVQTKPSDAYRFALGEALELPSTDPIDNTPRVIKIDRPLDFAAVTDHSEFMAETTMCSNSNSPGYNSATCEDYRNSNPAIGVLTGDFLNPLVYPDADRGKLCHEEMPQYCAGQLNRVWLDTMNAAEEAYDRSSSCGFTSFVAYEWTGTKAASNLHRNVFFRNRAVPMAPITFVEVRRPEELWTALENRCTETDTGCDVIVVPHNSNISTGFMFDPTRYVGVDTDGKEVREQYTKEWAERRAAFEPLVEIYQHKGSSECISGVSHPLASEDEFCSFEQIWEDLCTGGLDDSPDCIPACTNPGFGFIGGCTEPGDFIRGAMRRGLQEWDRVGANPFALGFVGSTDTHDSAAGAVKESTWEGHTGIVDGDANGRLYAVKKGNVIVNSRSSSPGGLTVLWAEENTRDALFDAMKRRESYATSGTRIVTRFFGGWSYDEDICSASDMVQQGYDSGVPMGGELPAQTDTNTAPTFVISAMQDAMGAPLQRIQIIKGWLSADGETHEKVYDVAFDGTLSADNSADNGASVDTATCALIGEGSSTLCDRWVDPDFDPNEAAFYYSRVIENPTCRWSQHDCNALLEDPATAYTCGVTVFEEGDNRGSCCDPTLPKTIQERAWTSPIWYIPPGTNI